ncbi:Ataxin-10 [Coemansia helicoidea]|uniref:Ataxin-10 n=1 Tax=Coemansia helicoidea TaxID=1286919 RepID=A0ACC1KQ09_9FUNG|nr:Ataxin-10 [Coemansia helicoidea]
MTPEHDFAMESARLDERLQECAALRAAGPHPRRPEVPADVSAADWARAHELFQTLLATAADGTGAAAACIGALADLCVYVRNAVALGRSNQDGASAAGVVGDVAATVRLAGGPAGAAPCLAAAGQALSNAVTQNQPLQLALLESELGCCAAAEDTAYGCLLSAESGAARTAGLVLLVNSVRAHGVLCRTLCAAGAGRALARRVGELFGESVDDAAEDKEPLFAVLSELASHGQLGVLLAEAAPLGAPGLLDALAVHCREHDDPARHARLADAELVRALARALAATRAVLERLRADESTTDPDDILAARRCARSALAALVLLTADMEPALSARLCDCGVVREAVQLLGLLSAYLPRAEKIGAGGAGTGGGDGSSESPVPRMFMFKRELIQIIGHAAHRNPAAQDLVRELGGLALVLDHTRIDDNHPYIREYAVVALRGLLDGNAASQACVESMEARGVSQDPQLTQAGLRVRLGPDGRPVVSRRAE